MFDIHTGTPEADRIAICACLTQANDNTYVSDYLRMRPETYLEAMARINFHNQGKN